MRRRFVSVETPQATRVPCSSAVSLEGLDARRERGEMGTIGAKIVGRAFKLAGGEVQEPKEDSR
jgi:hypothetical protein